MFFLIPICLVFAGLYLYMQREGRRIFALILKALASLSFVILGILCSPDVQIARLITGGLVLGCAADVLIGLRSVFVKRRSLFFLSGALLFLGGHLLYLAGVWPAVKYKVICVVLSALFAYMLLRWLFGRITVSGTFKAFGVVYFSVFLLLVFASQINAVTTPGAFTFLFAAGTLLFICSDVILNLYSFGQKLGFSFRVLYSALYYFGQLLIAVSLFFL